MATYPARADLFWRSVETVAPQVDLLYIILNDFQRIPTVPDPPSNVRFIIPENDLKDLGKFLQHWDDDDWVFLCDDDILYPANYVERTLTLIDGLPSSVRAAYGYHGTRYLPARFCGTLDSAIGFLKHRIHGAKLRKLRKSFFYENGLDAPRVVDQLGSGVAAARGRDIAPFSYMSGSQSFVDVRWARWCFENDVACICLPRDQHWLATLPTDESIYKSFTRRTPKFVRRELYSFAGEWALKSQLLDTA